MYYLFIPLLLVIGCSQKPEYKIGECFQKPDEAFVWKLQDADEKNFILQNKDNKIRKQPELNGYSKINCNF